ncbi:MAG: TfoX/Sxy family protein [Paracoccaceae bacterium]|nr:TfoX/Sxy family protein [Paracoccaceae bacterium]
MAVSDAQIEAVRDLFAPLGPITTRKMFGGLGIYADGVIFAILMSDDVLKLKGVGAMAETFEAEGWERWTYSREGSDKVTAMPYWTVPDALLDNPEEASAWARRALDAL